MVYQGVSDENFNILEVNYDCASIVDLDHPEITLPHLEVLDQVSRQLTHIYIEAGPKCNEADGRDFRVHLFEVNFNPWCFEHIFIKCPKLENLTVSDITLFNHDAEVKSE